MKVFLIILGVILFLVGALWLLQGLNIFSGYQMSGHRRWIVIGGGLAVVGIVLGVLGARFKKK